MAEEGLNDSDWNDVWMPHRGNEVQTARVIGEFQETKA